MWPEEVYHRRRHSSRGGESPPEARHAGIEEVHQLTDQITEGVPSLANSRKMGSRHSGALRCGLALEDEVALAAYAVISTLQHVLGTVQLTPAAVSLLCDHREGRSTCGVHSSEVRSLFG